MLRTVTAHAARDSMPVGAPPHADVGGGYQQSFVARGPSWREWRERSRAELSLRREQARREHVARTRHRWEWRRVRECERQDRRTKETAPVGGVATPAGACSCALPIPPINPPPPLCTPSHHMLQSPPASCSSCSAHPAHPRTRTLTSHPPCKQAVRDLHAPRRPRMLQRREPSLYHLPFSRLASLPLTLSPTHGPLMLSMHQLRRRRCFYQQPGLTMPPSFRHSRSP